MRAAIMIGIYLLYGAANLYAGSRISFSAGGTLF